MTPYLAPLGNADMYKNVNSSGYSVSRTVSSINFYLGTKIAKYDRVEYDFFTPWGNIGAIFVVMVIFVILCMFYYILIVYYKLPYNLDVDMRSHQTVDIDHV
eukprot:CAMPEP_0116899834 /NCGR_PEP_ID=MMETSP0467-20121206/8316_1 /TAXON_ID=283647 /ORGANISM="Mesodinium pulex, Strain SPMC105" /LENGTH=101 /DNA_ID=CAMNT_0004572877 /DNA_START=335 /DNA_END=640 /DNA_ORIENTATION=+